MDISRYWRGSENGMLSLRDAPNSGATGYSTDIDFGFVLALAAVGMVSMTSRQVTVTLRDGADLKQIAVPVNARLEHVFSEKYGGGSDPKIQTHLRFVFLTHGAANAGGAA